MHIWKVHVGGWPLPLVTFSRDIAYRTRADAINAGKNVIITRMTRDTYERQLIREE